MLTIIKNSGRIEIKRPNMRARYEVQWARCIFLYFINKSGDYDVIHLQGTSEEVKVVEIALKDFFDGKINTLCIDNRNDCLRICEDKKMTFTDKLDALNDNICDLSKNQITEQLLNLIKEEFEKIPTYDLRPLREAIIVFIQLDTIGKYSMSLYEIENKSTLEVLMASALFDITRSQFDDIDK